MDYAPKLNGQHHIRSAKTRDISLAELLNMSEREAWLIFVRARWGSLSKVTCPCPECHIIGKHYFYAKGKRWRCRSSQCNKYFTVLYGTPFQDSKLKYRLMLAGMFTFGMFANGISNDHVAGILGVQVKTAGVFIGKLREALYRTRDESMLSGTIHIDGGHFGGRPRHGRVRTINIEAVQEHVEEMLKRKGKQPLSTVRANVARRLKNRRIVIVLRQVSETPGEGAIRTIVAIANGESENYINSLVEKYVLPGSVIITDENPAYNKLGTDYIHKWVVHKEEFATIDGINSNQAESYFSRLRRHVLGVSHRIEPKYMQDIAYEMAWREDVRRLTHGQKLYLIFDAIFETGLSRFFRGYWQGVNRPGELIWSPDDNKPIIR